MNTTTPNLPNTEPPEADLWPWLRALSKQRPADITSLDYEAILDYTIDHCDWNSSISWTRQHNGTWIAAVIRNGERWHVGVKGGLIKIVDSSGLQDLLDVLVNTRAAAGESASDKPMTVNKTRRRPIAAGPKLILKAAEKMFADEASFYDSDLFLEVADDLGEKPRRAFDRAVTALVKDGWLFQHGDKLSLHSILPVEGADATES